MLSRRSASARFSGTCRSSAARELLGYSRAEPQPPAVRLGRTTGMTVSGRRSPSVTGCITDQELLVSQDIQQSVLVSRAEEAAVTEQVVRQSVALQVKYEQENRIALAAKEYKAALDTLEARNAESVHQITTAAAKREFALEEALRAALAERDEARAAAAEAAAAHKREFAAALEEVRRFSAEAVRREHAASAADHQQARVTAPIQLRVLTAELRGAERHERLSMMQASAAVGESAEQSTEVTTLRRERRKSVAEAEELQEQLRQLTIDSQEARRSFIAARKCASTMLRRQNARHEREAEQRHADAVARLRKNSEVALRAEQEASAARMEVATSQGSEAMARAHDEEARRLQAKDEERARVESELQAELLAEKQRASAAIMQQQSRLARQAAAEATKADALVSGVRLELQLREEQLEAQSAEFAWLQHEVTRAARQADEASRVTAQVLLEAAAAEAHLETELHDAREEGDAQRGRGDTLQVRLDGTAADLAETRAAVAAAAVAAETAAAAAAAVESARKQAASELEKLHKAHEALQTRSEQRLGAAAVAQEKEVAARRSAEEAVKAAEAEGSQLRSKLEAAESQQGETGQQLGKTEEALEAATKQASEREQVIVVLQAEVRLCEAEAERDRGEAQLGQEEGSREGEAAAQVMGESLRDAEEAWGGLLETHEEVRERLEGELEAGNAGWAEGAAVAAAKEAAGIEAAHSAGAAALAQREAQLEKERVGEAARRDKATAAAASTAAAALRSAEYAHSLETKKLLEEAEARDIDLARLRDEVERLTEELARETAEHAAAAARRDELDAELGREQLLSAGQTTRADEAEAVAEAALAEKTAEAAARVAVAEAGVAELEARLLRREAEWREACERRDEEHEALQQSRDELQARFDWLATRWRAREPRPIDVEVVGALKAELERQLRVTDHAVRQSRAFEEKLGQLDSSYVMFGKEGTRVRVERGPTPGDRSGGRSPVPAHAGGGRGAAWAAGESAFAGDQNGGPRPLDSRASSRAPSPSMRRPRPTELEVPTEPPTPLRQPSPSPRRPQTSRPQSANPTIGAGLRPFPPPQTMPMQGPPGSLTARKARPATAPHRAAPPRARAASARGGRRRPSAEEMLIDAALNPRARTSASPREMGEHGESMAVSMAVSMGASMGAHPDTGISPWAGASPSASTQPSCTRAVPEFHLHGR